MKTVVVGLGVQGRKRGRVAGVDLVANVDPAVEDANYTDLRDVPLASYDAALLCVPDAPKIDLLRYLVTNGKHALVEKPLWAAEDAEIVALEKATQKAGVVCYTAYNHRFEPHYIRMRDLIESGELGEIYRCRMFYGNGTARLVRESPWRDKGAGVLPDLGSHLLDTAAFWFEDLGQAFDVVSASCHENERPDHVIVMSEATKPKLELEMTLLMWRNHFTCDVLAERGTAHIRSLCKWGPSSFTVRKRVLPSGRPSEETVTLVEPDPTWEAEYKHFKALCTDRAPTNLANDIWLNSVLRDLGDQALAKVSP